MSLSLCKLSLPGSRYPPADQPKECDTCLDVNFLHSHVCDHPDAWMPAKMYFTHRANQNQDRFNDIHDIFNGIHECVCSVRVGGVVFPGFPFLELGNYGAAAFTSWTRMMRFQHVVSGVKGFIRIHCGSARAEREALDLHPGALKSSGEPSVDPPLGHSC